MTAAITSSANIDSSREILFITGKDLPRYNETGWNKKK